jgi:arylsulfatase A-like enzyme
MEPSEFKGRIGRYHWESESYWPAQAKAPEGSPNVVVIVLDDVGFAQLGCFGSDIDTPVMDRLAQGGIRYSNFHTTALCSPTRACVLTGRNHHSAGMGRIIELATGFPGYDARIPRSVGFLPAMLAPHGYAAWAVGKWHLTPEEECNVAAARDRWPLARGFERFYGFFAGETHQNYPALVEDNHQIRPPAMPEDGYHFTEDIVDQAIRLITDLRQIDPAKPFFLYLAPGACHSPHQAPQEFRDKYRGRFDRGWDAWRTETFARQKQIGVVAAHTVLSDRPDWVPAWESLDEQSRAVYARYMEVFAAYLDHTDTHIGRLVDELESRGELDDTLLMVLSDNGASSEGGPVGSVNDLRSWNFLASTVEEAHDRIDEIGGPRIHNNYPWGWTVAGNTPFRRWKRETHEGGVADPFLVHWPAGIDARGGLRHQYVHAIDIVPTILEVVGIAAPEVINGVAQRPVEGVSFAYTFDSPEAPERHQTQYYEMFGTRALYHQGYKAVVHHELMAEEPGLDRAGWELYDLRSDPSETRDLAETEPDLLAAMVERWWVEASRYQVLPLDNRPFSDFVLERPHALQPRRRYEYKPGSTMVPESVAVNVKNRPHRVSATIDVPADGIEGTILAQGSVLGGWALFVVDSRLRYVHNLSGKEWYTVASDRRLEPGSREVAFSYGHDPRRPRWATLTVDGDVVGEAEIPQFTWNRISLTGAGLTCGYSWAPATADEFVAPFAFPAGRLSTVVVEVLGDPVVNPVAEAMDAITAQ